MEDSRPLRLSCCECIDIHNERNRILGWRCNCEKLDFCIDSVFKCEEGMHVRWVCRALSSCQDRLRVPWKGGDRRVALGTVTPVILLPLLGYIAAHGVWISVVVFSALPLFLIYAHYVAMRLSSQTKFFFSWSVTSLVLVTCEFELLVNETLDIRTDEMWIFRLFTALIVVCAVKTRQTAERSHVKGDVKIDDDSDLECAECRKTVLPRAFHCHICQVCVMKRDLHCAWLDCCIGEGNYQWYVGTLAAALCQLTLCSNLILTTACHPFRLVASIMLPDDCSDVYFDVLYGSMFVTALYATLALVFVAVLLAHECWLVSLGVTGHEWRALADTRHCSRPYSRGPLRNWIHFFSGNRYKQIPTMAI